MKTRRINRGMITMGIVLSLVCAQPMLAKDYDNHWAKVAIETWSGHGIMTGYEDGSFKPSGKITRAELAVTLDRALGLGAAPEGTKGYTDVKAGAWYTDAVTRVMAQGLMYAPGTEFKPNQYASREEVAYAMAQAYQLQTTSVPPSFKDTQKISNWAKPSVDALVSQGLLKGYEDGSFKPQGDITRAEFVTVLDNVVAHYITDADLTGQTLTGNVMVTDAKTVLKDVTIEGNLYLAPALGEAAVTLDNVQVSGTIYIQGGHVSLDGDYNQVVVQTANPVKLVAGSIKHLQMKQSGASIDLAKDTVVAQLTIYKSCEVTGTGAVKQRVSMIGDKAHVESAGVYMSGQYVPLDMVGDTVVIDVQKLIREQGLNAKMDSLILFSSHDDVYVKGYTGGKFLANTNYGFRKANQEIGILQEMIDQITRSSSQLQNLVSSMGVTGNSAFDLLGMGNSLELGMLSEQYYFLADMIASYTGVVVPTRFEFTYDLYQGDEKVNQVKILLVVQ